VIYKSHHYDNNGKITITGKQIEYNKVLVLCNEGELPQVITANVLVVCKETRQVLIHKRSFKSKHYPNVLSNFGGSFMPETKIIKDNSRIYDKNLFATAAREFHEETRIKIEEDISKEQLKKCTTQLGGKNYRYGF